MPIRAILFDLDGTLLDTMADIHRALNRALEEHQMSAISPQECRTLVGWGARRLITAALPEAHRRDEKLVERIQESFGWWYRQYPVVESTPYPGIMALIDDLSTQRDIALGILSNKPDDLVQQVVPQAFPEHPFAIVRGASEVYPHKPDPTAAQDMIHRLGSTPEHTLFLGDSAVDMETARRVGCYALGAAWGYRTAEELVAAGADRLCATAPEAHATIAAWITQKNTEGE